MRNIFNTAQISAGHYLDENAIAISTIPCIYENSINTDITLVGLNPSTGRNALHILFQFVIHSHHIILPYRNLYITFFHMLLYPLTNISLMFLSVDFNPCIFTGMSIKMLNSLRILTFWPPLTGSG